METIKELAIFIDNLAISEEEKIVLVAKIEAYASDMFQAGWDSAN